MEKKMYKFTPSQNDNLKKKQKEIKLLTNYIPVKKTHLQSNISEYETEQSIQKNFSNKCQKNKTNTQAKSVQTTHTNQLSPRKKFAQNRSKRNYSNVTNSSKGSVYNLNNFNIYDYFSEKVIVTQKKFIDYKDNKINTLKKELSLIKQEINLYEKKNIQGNSNNTSKSKNSKNNCIQLVPKILYVNKNNNKYLLVNNNNSYLSLNTFWNNEIFNSPENADKKLEKHLSNLLTENNSENNLKYKNPKIKKNKKNANITDNKKNLLSVIYQSKKGCYNTNTNNYDHNSKYMMKTNNIKKNENSFKKNNIDKEINHNLYFYTNKTKEKQIPIMDKKNIQKLNVEGNENLDLQYKALNEKMNILFNSFFDYYDRNNQSLKK